ncbi:MAG: DNA-binding protein WhiA [Thermaerobacterales bacterium]
MALELSFTEKIKEDLILVRPEKRTLIRAELSALVAMLSSRSDQEGSFQWCIMTRRAALIRKIWRYTKYLYILPAEVAVVRPAARRRRGNLYTLTIEGPGDAAGILADLGLTALLQSRRNRIRPPLAAVERSLVSSKAARAAYLRGLFLAVGHAGPPRKGYHLEWLFRDRPSAVFCAELAAALGGPAGVAARPRGYAVYIKGGDQVAALLNWMGAHRSLLSFEGARVYRDIKGRLNRLVNAETANVGKAAIAAADQIRDIKNIEGRRGLEQLPPALRELARMRLAYPELSLRDLGARMEPPITKSAVAHRMRRLRAAALTMAGKGFRSQNPE